VSVGTECHDQSDCLLVGLFIFQIKQAKQAISVSLISQLPVMPQSVLDWGINSPETVYHPYWRNPYVTSEDEQILVSLWQLPDRVMLGVYNYNGEQAKDVTLKVDLDSLNLIPQLPWQEFIGVRDLWTADGAARPATFEFHNAALSLKTLQPHTLHLIGVRRY